MINIGKRLYFDKITGHVFFEVNEQTHYVSVVVPTIEQDIQTFIPLTERNRETFDVLELPFGAYAQDFAESNGYRVNPETKTLEFSYPDPNEPEAPQEFRKPLSEEVEKLKAEDLNNKEAIAELYLLSMGGF